MSKRTELKIDPEFRKLCPPLSESERAALKESIESEGCRDAIVVWDGTIVDGHNRYLSGLPRCLKAAAEFQTPALLWGQLERIYCHLDALLGPNWREEIARQRQEWFDAQIEDDEELAMES